MKSAPIASTDGGELFKPHKPMSILGPPSEPKAGKPKPLFDR